MLPTATMDAASELNHSQQDAVRTLSGPLLVLAGAGTGKTRVITFRMAELIRHGIAADRILSVTFTNKAAREMLERTQKQLGKRLRERPFISTFHALCVNILRQDIPRLGYPQNFVIYDRGDQESAARKALRDIRVTDSAIRPGDLLSQISRWKMAGVRPDDALDAIEDDRGYLAAAAYRRYQAGLKASGATDFDDLLMLTEQLFREAPDVLEKHQSRFDHVQIDEYQDTNELQFRLIAALVKPHRNLCVVGDDDQSIYGWRGAEIKHILGFQQQFPGAKVVRLEDNYRCTKPIIQLANQLVRHNRGRHLKTLVAHKNGPQVAIKDYPDEQAEAEGTVRDINYLVNQLKVSPRDIAILFRTNEQPRLFESELRRVRVPYELVGGQSFFDRKEIKDLQSYLRVIAHPGDEQSLRRIINVPTRGISDSVTEKISERAVRGGLSFWEAVPKAVEAGEVTPRALKAIHEFQQLMHNFHERFQQPNVKLAELLQGLISAIDYESEISKQYKEPAQQLARSAIVEDFVNALAEYQERAKSPSLSEFLDEIALTGRDDFGKKDDEFEKPAIRLMTLHSAKGLEFPRVYLVGLEEGLLPHIRSVQEELDEGDPKGIEEERRLCYVGITRARDHLTISRAVSRMKWGKRKESKPSRFLREMHTPMKNPEMEKTQIRNPKSEFRCDEP